VAISADGRFVAFSSASITLVPNDTNGRNDIFVRDRVLGRTERVNVTSSGAQGGRRRSRWRRRTIRAAVARRRPRWASSRSCRWTRGGSRCSSTRSSWSRSSRPRSSRASAAGLLDGAGGARLRVHVPSDPSLAGLRFYVAALVLDAGSPSGVRGLSNALPVTIAP